MLVKLRVNQSTFDDIKERILNCGDPHERWRLLSPREAGHQGPHGGLNLSQVVLVVDEKEDK